MARVRPHHRLPLLLRDFEAPEEERPTDRDVVWRLIGVAAGLRRCAAHHKASRTDFDELRRWRPDLLLHLDVEPPELRVRRGADDSRRAAGARVLLLHFDGQIKPEAGVGAIVRRNRRAHECVFDDELGSDDAAGRCFDPDAALARNILASFAPHDRRHMALVVFNRPHIRPDPAIRLKM